MLPKQPVISWTRKFIYAWLIFCIGGVGSLSYFDGFAPGHSHGEHPFHLSIFEASPHVDNPFPLPSEVLAEQTRFWLVSRLKPQTDILSIPPNLTNGFTRFFASGLSDGYVLTSSHLKIFNLPVVLGLIALAALKGRSAWLPPLDKPPIFSA